MKASFFVVTLLVICVGCTPQQPSEQLTQQQIDQIKKDTKAAVDSIIIKFNRLDAEGAMQYYWDLPEFVAFNPDGSRSDYQAGKKSATDFVNSAAAATITTVQEEYRVLTRDLVLCGWLGRQELTLKSGVKVITDPFGVTFLFKNIAGQWKVLYCHESGTYVTQKAVTK